MCESVATLIVSIILLDILVHAIIVERNLHSYYRLPTATVKTANDSEDFYILQCPFRSSMNIPRPEMMPVCLIVGRYSSNEEQQKELVKSKTRPTLNTQVDFRQLQPTNLVKLMKIKNGKPYTVLLKPVNKKEVSYKTAKTQVKEKPKSNDIKFVLTSPKASSLNQTIVFYSVPLIEKLQINDSLAVGSTKATQKSVASLKPSTSLEIEFLPDALKVPATQETPLKYLGVRDTLKKLQLTPKPHLPLSTNQTQYKSEKFFADLGNYKKGFRSKGFQNMYHRDEIFNDHIFYDDLQQMGNYRIKQHLPPNHP